MLEIRDLHVQFHTSDHEAVRGISLKVDEGEIMGLVGESGSGKSVTMYTIMGLLADNGDPVTDLLYSTNWLPLAFAVAYKVTNDPVFKERWQSLASFLSRTQMRSAVPLLDGCWCRGMDVARMEAYGMPHDVGWGPCSVESGWTVGEILMGLGYGMYLHMDE